MGADLVVIDEASQSDIWALPALMRGKKLLIVGDEKQVSPSAVGVEEQKIKDMRATHLAQQPHASLMTVWTVRLTRARVSPADNAVMLKEHFRSVPAIIEYSNREFHRGAIRPLRVPKANERLDPPLIDVFVKGGTRKVDVNAGEAIAIIDEIEAIIADPATNPGRSIGVVTLVGTAQAKHITKLLHERIAPSDIVAHRIAVGAPPVFQGRERDIMLISMVLDEKNNAAASKLENEQRFNVALSRARDRTYLFRSVGHESKFQGRHIERQAPATLQGAIHPGRQEGQLAARALRIGLRGSDVRRARPARLPGRTASQSRWFPNRLRC